MLKIILIINIFFCIVNSKGIKHNMRFEPAVTTAPDSSGNSQENGSPKLHPGVGALASQSSEDSMENKIINVPLSLKKKLQRAYKLNITIDQEALKNSPNPEEYVSQLLKGFKFNVMPSNEVTQAASGVESLASQSSEETTVNPISKTHKTTQRNSHLNTVSHSKKAPLSLKQMLDRAYKLNISIDQEALKNSPNPEEYVSQLLKGFKFNVMPINQATKAGLGVEALASQSSEETTIHPISKTHRVPKPSTQRNFQFNPVPYSKKYKKPIPMEFTAPNSSEDPDNSEGTYPLGSQSVEQSMQWHQNLILPSKTVITKKKNPGSWIYDIFTSTGSMVKRGFNWLFRNPFAIPHGHKKRHTSDSINLIDNNYDNMMRGV